MMEGLRVALSPAELVVEFRDSFSLLFLREGSDASPAGVSCFSPGTLELLGRVEVRATRLLMIAMLSVAFLICLYRLFLWKLIGRRCGEMF
jgi:hypothetical protein